MHRILLLASVAVASLVEPASAQTRRPAEHSIPWFLANPTIRAATIRACRDDMRLARQDECTNAELAETRVYARRLSPHRELNSPSYWQSSPAMMANLRAACARRGPGDAMYLRHCGVLSRIPNAG